MRNTKNRIFHQMNFFTLQSQCQIDFFFQRWQTSLFCLNKNVMWNILDVEKTGNKINISFLRSAIFFIYVYRSTSIILLTLDKNYCMINSFGDFFFGVLFSFKNGSFLYNYTNILPYVNGFWFIDGVGTREIKVVW